MNIDIKNINRFFAKISYSFPKKVLNCTIMAK